MHSNLREGDMIRFVIGTLMAHGYKVWRQPTTGFFDLEYFIKLLPGTGFSIVKIRELARRSYRSQEVKGVPDVIGFHKGTGHFIGVEIKIGDDQLRPEQRDFLLTLYNSGGVALIAKTPEQFTQSFQKYLNHEKTDQ
jgi:VRR-NUC domain